MAVALVGLPGAGKSAVGRLLGMRLALPFIDTDHVIEQRIGCSIRDFFDREGEVAFRDQPLGGLMRRVLKTMKV